ncbi:DUF1392 domain-containing protein [Nostoc sp. CCCryo 231-06]|nr:DUF1392 domain-containing protein [Nostoc sp. CCCryo 231-06]
MTNLVQNLEQCWYISPPWGQRIPPDKSFRASVRQESQSIRLLLWCRVIATGLEIRDCYWE